MKTFLHLMLTYVILISCCNIYAQQRPEVTVVTEEGYELEIIYDVIDRTVFEMYVSMQEGEPRYCPFVCDLMDGLKPEMKFGDKSEDEFYKLMSEYSAQYDQGSNSFYGYQDEEIIAFFFYIYTAVFKRLQG